MFHDKSSIFSKKIFVVNFILQPLFQSTQHFYEKRKGSGAESGSVLVTNGSGCGSKRPKNIRIRIPNTVFFTFWLLLKYENHYYTIYPAVGFARYADKNIQ
jgi:hypothetical protein